MNLCVFGSIITEVAQCGNQRLSIPLYLKLQIAKTIYVVTIFIIYVEGNIVPARPWTPSFGQWVSSSEGLSMTIEFVWADILSVSGSWTNVWNRGPFVGALGYAMFMRVGSDRVERAEEQALLGWPDDWDEMIVIDSWASSEHKRRGIELRYRIEVSNWGIYHQTDKNWKRLYKSGVQSANL
jgi:hypothetical protein